MYDEYAHKICHGGAAIVPTLEGRKSKYAVFSFWSYKPVQRICSVINIRTVCTRRREIENLEVVGTWG